MAFGKRHLLLAAAALMLTLGMAGALDLTQIGALFGKGESEQCAAPAADLGWIALSLAAILLGAMLASFGWAISGAVGSQKYMDFLRMRLWDLVETAALLSIFSLAMAEVFNSGLYKFGVSNIDTARTYSALIRNTAALDFTLVVGSSMLVTFVARQNPQLRLPNLHAFVISFQLYPAFRPIFDGLGILVQLLSTVLAEWFAHDFMLCLIKVNMLTLLLPAGFFLRAFGLKAGGNALIGVALALYFIYPYMMNMVGEMVTKHVENEIRTSSEPGLFAACSNNKPICCVGDTTGRPENLNEPFIANGPDWQTSLEDRISQEKVLKGEIEVTFSGWIPGVTNGKYMCMFNTRLARAYGMFMEAAVGMGVFSLVAGPGAQVIIGRLLTSLNMNWILVLFLAIVIAFLLSSTYEVVFVLFVVSIVMPIFMIFITLTLAREIAKVLGTEIDLSALEKII